LNSYLSSSLSPHTLLQPAPTVTLCETAGGAGISQIETLAFQLDLCHPRKKRCTLRTSLLVCELFYFSFIFSFVFPANSFNSFALVRTACVTVVPLSSLAISANASSSLSSKISVTLLPSFALFSIIK